MEEKKERLRELLAEWKNLRLRVEDVDRLIFSILGIQSYEEFYLDKKINLVIACAGKGTRFFSSIPKVLYTINGRMIFEYIYKVIEKYIQDIYMIVSYQNYQEIKTSLQRYHLSIHYVFQKRNLGDGDAVYQINNFITDKSGDSLILWGDAIYKKDTVLRILALHQIYENDFTCLTEYTKKPYAGFSRDLKGEFMNTFHSRIGEVPEIGENDCSFFMCNTKKLLTYLEIMFQDYERMRKETDIGEMYFIHILDYMKKDYQKIDLVCCKQKNDVLEFNTIEEAKKIEQALKKSK